MNQSKPKTRVLVVGGGFGGVKAALEISKHKEYAITLLSERPNFHYYPTLYHTATGGTVKQSRIPLAELFTDLPVKLVQGTAVTVDRAKKVVKDSAGTAHHYDILIMALGVVTNYFGIPGLKEYAYGIKSPEEALRFKNHLHDQLIDMGRPDPNYVIVGGGPTGIELSGAMSSYMREIVEAHDIKRRRSFHIDLVEAAPRLVPRMPARLGRTITRRLQKLGVKVHLGKTVEGATADGLTVSGKPIQSHTIVWTAGVANHPFFKENAFALTERGKVVVNDYLEAEDGVYVIGDNANTEYSGVAQTALYDAIFVAENLVRKTEGKLMQRYTPKRPVYVFPVGDNWAAVQWGKLQFSGLIGGLLRSAADFIGFKDLQPFWQAAKQWTTEFEQEETCKVCVEHRRKQTE